MSNSEEVDRLEMQVDEALAEYLHKSDSGEGLDREAFLASHPELREQLATLLSAADWIEQLAGPTLAELAKAAPDVDASQAVSGLEETLNYNPDLGRHSSVTVPDAHFAPDANLGSLTAWTDASLEFSCEGLAQPRELSQPTLPCRFGDYMLERVLGRGGMGVVYFGHQISLDRPVAIKMIRSGALASGEEVQRFYAEARSAARLDHPNIVTVYQCGEYDGHRYFSMDYVPGTDLARMIKDGPLPCKRAARYVRDAARAIQYAHDRGILHRDLKPANVLIDEADEVHITDFGLAKSIGNDTGLTATGAALGTPSYMSPEQAAGRIADQHHATDVYSLGAILFTIVTGRPPFKADAVVQTVMQVIHRPAPMARTIQSDIDEDIETIIDVCLQKSAERRYASAGALADDLDRYLAGSPIEARPMSDMRRAWYWLLGVPIFGALLDHRVIEPTDAHRWVQRGMISIACLMLALWIAWLLPTDDWMDNRMPRQVRIAAGSVGGSYDQIAQAICGVLGEQTNCEAYSIESEGSPENFEKLINREVDMALLQADSVSSSNVAVIAPLFYEPVHILVRSGSGLKGLKQLKGQRVVVGSEKSGAHNVARLLLTRVGLSLQDIEVDRSDWRGLISDGSADAAIVISKAGARPLLELLQSGDYQLAPIYDSLDFALDEPAFHPYLLTQEVYPECGISDEGVATVATAAFLVTRPEAPSALVRTVLEKLFAPDVVKKTGILSAERAAHWHGLAWHPAAMEFFHAYRGSTAQLDEAL